MLSQEINTNQFTSEKNNNTDKNLSPNKDNVNKKHTNHSHEGEYIICLLLAIIVLFPAIIGFFISNLFIRILRKILLLAFRVNESYESIVIIKIVVFLIILCLQLFIITIDLFGINGIYIYENKTIFGNVSTMFSNINNFCITYFLLLTFSFFSFFNILSIICVLLFDYKIIDYKTNIINEYVRSIANNNEFYVKKNIFYEILIFFIDFNDVIKINKKIEKYNFLRKQAPKLNNGMIVEYDPRNIAKNIIFDKEKWNKHCIFIGMSQTGKSNNILNLIISAVKNNYPVIYINYEGNNSVSTSLKQISSFFNANYILWRTNNNVERTKYYPFFNKEDNYRQQIIMFAFQKFSGEVNESETKILKTLTDFLIECDIEINFHSVEEYSNINLIKKLANARSTKVEFKEKLKKLYEFYSKNENLIILLNDEIKKFNIEFKDLIVNSETEGKCFSIHNIMESKKQNSILNINISDDINERMQTIIQRLFYIDIKVSRIYNEIQRKIDNKYLLTCIAEPAKLFFDLSNIEQTISSMQSSKIIFGFDVNTTKKIPQWEINIIYEILDVVSTYFIHKNTDEEFNKIIYEKLIKCRIVETDFFIEDLENKYKKYSKQTEYVKNVLNIHKVNEAHVTNLINNIKYLPIGSVVLKSFYTFSSPTSTKKTYSIKDICYGDIVSCEKVEYIIDNVANLSYSNVSKNNNDDILSKEKMVKIVSEHKNADIW